MIVGFAVVAILSGLPNNIARLFGTQLYTQPAWLPVMEFPWWRIMFMRWFVRSEIVMLGSLSFPPD